MKNTHQRVLQAFHRVLSFGATNPTIIPPATGSSDTWAPLTRQLDAIGTITTQVTDAASDQLHQAANAKLDATSEPSLRKTLRDKMHAIAQVAQALKKTIPGIGTLKMPANSLQAAAVLKYAEGLKKQASTYESVLIEHGLGTDIIAQLQGAIAALQTSMNARGAAQTAQAGAGKQLSDGIALGLQYIKVMDAALTETLKSNPPKLAEWKKAKRITIKGVVSSNRSTSAPVTTTPATPTPVAPVPVPVQAAATPQSAAHPA